MCNKLCDLFVHVEIIITECFLSCSLVLEMCFFFVLHNCLDKNADNELVLITMNGLAVAVWLKFFHCVEANVTWIE